MRMARRHSASWRVLENGAGPRLLLRTELDALPVEEKTGLDYASTVTTTNAQGQQVGVMHACGHDLHMTVLLGAAREMASRKSEWHGTLMLIGQPAEEQVEGAAAMLADHLYERFGRPDFVLSEHDSPDVPAGSIAVKGGPLLASATTINVTMRGIGGHGSAPAGGQGPNRAGGGVCAGGADDREPADRSTAACGADGGHDSRRDEEQHHSRRSDDGPDAAHLLGCGARSDCGRVRRTANGLAEAYGIPADRMPTVTVGESTPATINDAALAERVRADVDAVLGKEHVLDAHAIMGSEDVGLFSLDGKIPAVMYWLGAADPEKLAESRKTGVPLPGLHSALFYPVYAPAITTGVTAMSGVALELLK